MNRNTARSHGRDCHYRVIVSMSISVNVNNDSFNIVRDRNGSGHHVWWTRIGTKIISSSCTNRFVYQLLLASRLSYHASTVYWFRTVFEEWRLIVQRLSSFETPVFHPTTRNWYVWTDKMIVFEEDNVTIKYIYKCQQILFDFSQ